MNFLLTVPVAEHETIKSLHLLLATARGVDLAAGERIGSGVFLLPVLRANGASDSERLMAVGFGWDAMQRIKYGVEQAVALSGDNPESAVKFLNLSQEIAGVVSRIFVAMAQLDQRHCFTVIDEMQQVPVTSICYLRTRNAVVTFTDAVRQYDHSRN